MDDPKTNNDMPNRAPNMAKAEGDRWASDPGTVERQDRDRPETGASADPSGTGISNRSEDEEEGTNR
jgi:hypothetical protein